MWKVICMATQQGGAEIMYDKSPTITAAAGMSGNNQPVICYGISAYESNSMKSSNPHSGIYEAETARCLDINGGNPACNQGGCWCFGNGQAHQFYLQDKMGAMNCMHDQQIVMVRKNELKQERRAE